MTGETCYARGTSQVMYGAVILHWSGKTARLMPGDCLARGSEARKGAEVINPLTSRLSEDCAQARSPHCVDCTQCV
jgi:hypothetical protein